MSFRLLTIRLLKHGRFLLQSNWKRDIHSNILEQNQKSRNRLSASANAIKSSANSISAKNPKVDSLPRQSKTLAAYGLFRVGQHARKVFIDNILNRVTNAYSEELRHQATKKLFYGDSASFFALVGVNLATGSGIITKEDELESVCWEIREAASRLQSTWYNDIPIKLSENFNIDKLDVGPPIAKGCAAVVYAASFQNEQSTSPVKDEIFSKIPNTNIRRYPFALKMMFNYDIQSNAISILRAMYRETVPARQRYLNSILPQWDHLFHGQIAKLAPHPNIVCMYGFFCDEVREFPDGDILYPIAQPQRINPIGYGRNMSLFLLMKRYDYSLRTLLDTEELTMRNKLLLLTQLLEAVAHINRHSIAHRDIKTDNILVELNEDSPPLLVLSDFGCCSADKVHGLQVPYNSYDMDKGGNTALMAPEIINKQPGPFSVLDYTKADLWACGAIAYEIFGQKNPFYSSTNGVAVANGGQTLSFCSSNYNEKELPPLPAECPLVVKELIKNILNPNPSKRVSSDTAANILQLFLWAPSKWLKSESLPSSSEVLQWLLTLTTKVMISNVDSVYWMGLENNKRRTYVEYLIISSFLARARLCRIRTSLEWIQNVI